MRDYGNPKHGASPELQALREQIRQLRGDAHAMEQAELEAASQFHLGQILEWNHGRAVIRGRVISFRSFCDEVSPVVRVYLKSGKEAGIKALTFDRPRAAGDSHG